MVYTQLLYTKYKHYLAWPSYTMCSTVHAWSDNPEYSQAKRMAIGRLVSCGISTLFWCRSCNSAKDCFFSRRAVDFGTMKWREALVGSCSAAYLPIRAWFCSHSMYRKDGQNHFVWGLRVNKSCPLWDNSLERVDSKFGISVWRIGLTEVNLKQSDSVNMYDMWQYNVIVLFRFSFVYTERSNRLNGRSVSSVCLTAFWQNGGETIA